ncbi:CD109 antigen-like [Saccostrea cucullata]|uniref:CD109 antigen-like n=1 Tax=Saccostrea cuccullata TaxID=36930 RepID=UPI002ED6329A
MKFQILFWISLSFLLVWIGIYAASASKLLAAFPKIVRPGSPLIVNCHLLKRGSQNLILELVKDGSTIRQNTSTVTFGKQHNIMLNVPPDLTSSKNLRVKLSYSGDSIVSPIQYDDLKSVVLIQTDRGMYAKNEEVKMRIVTLTQSLKPLKTQISVAIYDGKNKLVQQWLNVRGVLGVFSRKFSIPGDPNNGQWRIVVDDTKRKTEKTFIVRKYVVPKYKVDISCPTFFTRSTRRLRCLVKARYMFGRKVNGVVHAQLVTKTRDGDKFLYNHHDNIRGEFWITTTKNTSFIFENDIEVIARVSDPSTGTTVVNSAVINLRRDAKMIWSLEPIRKHFQPGLKFVTFVSFKQYTFIIG